MRACAQILDKDAHKASHAVKLYMLELYCDELMDLLRVVDKDKKGSPDVRFAQQSSATLQHYITWRCTSMPVIPCDVIFNGSTRSPVYD